MDARTLKNRSIAMMAVCSLMWSIGGICIKLIPWPAMLISGSRCLIATGVIALYMKVKKIPLRLNKKSLLAGAALAGTLTGFVAANKLTTAANAIVLQFTAPVFIMLLSALIYKKRFKKSDYLAVAFTLLGICMCFMDRMSTGSLSGNLIAIGSGFTYGSMYVINGESDPDSRMSGVFFGQFFAVLISIPFFFSAQVETSAVILSAVGLLGAVQLGIPYILLALASNHCPPLLCCLISAIEPLLSPLWVFLGSGELPGAAALVGGLLVVATVTVWNIWSDRQEAAIQNSQGASL